MSWVALVCGVAWSGGCGGTVQPPPQCTVGKGQHAVRYTLKEGTGACAQKKSEVVGAQVFRVPGSGEAPTLALKPAALAALEGQDADHAVASSGDFTSEYPGAEGVCVAPSLSEARQVVEAGAVDIRYAWSDVRVQGSAAIPGTQWAATLRYSEGDCTATYEAVGIFPAISCARTEGDVVVMDEGLCHQPRPGLSLDPAFPVTCDEASGLCVLEGSPPALMP